MDKSFEIGLLQDYFRNIIMACDNTEHDERPYIRSVAEIGYNLISKTFGNTK